MFILKNHKKYPSLSFLFLTLSLKKHVFYNWPINNVLIKLPLNKDVYTQTMLMARHQRIAKRVDEEFGVTRWRSLEKQECDRQMSGSGWPLSVAFLFWANRSEWLLINYGYTWLFHGYLHWLLTYFDYNKWFRYITWDNTSISSYVSSEHEPQSMRARDIYTSDASSRLKILSKVSLWLKRTFVLPSLFSIPTIMSLMTATPGL